MGAPEVPFSDEAANPETLTCSRKPLDAQQNNVGILENREHLRMESGIVIPDDAEVF